MSALPPSIDSDSEPPPPPAPSEARVARRAAAGALAAELGHDLQGPLNLFRLMTEQVERGQPLDEEDAALLREELERLSRLSARLREMARWQLMRAEHTPRRLVELALASLPALQVPGFELELSGAAEATISCDAALVARALRELIDNALEARLQHAGVRWVGGEEPCLCVWDDGPGFDGDPGRAARFGVTTREGAAGLGLGLAHRAARAHGFRLELARAGGLTEARLWIVAPSGGGRSTKGAG
ncbi:MAG: hypothetical protein EOO73_01355 [Myxococcales bacterium]|nr:MAG: hypothetical protein EOO73_01355 [Myxococcales bacterium]